MKKLLVLLIMIAGCGDPASCPSGTFVVITSPNAVTGVSGDLSQLTVTAMSSLLEGESATLTVTLPDDTEYSTTANANATGTLTFSGLAATTIADGVSLSLSVVADGGNCGEARDDVSIQVGSGNGGGACALELLTPPVAGVGPESLYNSASDIEATAGLQIAVVSDGDIEALDLATGSKTTLSVTGEPQQVTIPEGRYVLSAICGASSSAPVPVWVDTVAPDCSLNAPATILSLDDEDPMAAGTQFTVTVTSTSADVDGLSPVLEVGAAVSNGNAFDAGTSDAQLSVNSPGPFTITATVSDAAQNECVASTSNNHVASGCSISFTSPTAPITTDSNNDATDGLQGILEVDVDPACAGQTVTTTCGDGMSTAVVPNGGGVTQLNVTWCGNAQCEVTQTCTTSVTSVDGFPTSVDSTVQVDTQPPSVGLVVTSPSVPCGALITNADDIDGDATNGIQIEATVNVPTAVTREVELTNALGTQTITSGVGGITLITLEPGANDMVGKATDLAGNVGMTAVCTINLADIAVNFATNVADGQVSALDGSVNGTDLTFDICGTVSQTGASVDVTIDGGAAIAATVTGTNWCVTTTLAQSPPDYAVVATATAGTSSGQASLTLTVDVAPPGMITGGSLFSPSRHEIEAEWVTPADADSFLVRVGDIMFTDANFDTTGTAVVAPAAGGTVSANAVNLHAATEYYVGVIALDAAGNRSVVTNIGPITPSFDTIGPVLAGDPGDLSNDNALGFSIARGKFNDDEFYDVAVSAPYRTNGGHVYVYYGSATGISTTPDLQILSASNSGDLMGRGLTAVEWSTTGRHDLVVSAPFGDSFNGRIDIYNGGASFDSTADISITSSLTSTYFNFGTVGMDLETADYDGDGIDDIVAGLGSSGGSNGGLAVIFGGSVTSSFVLDENDATALNGAIVQVIEDPQPATFDIFGDKVFNLGSTTADGSDDIGVGYADGNRFVVLRGIGKPATAGVHFRNVGAGDAQFTHPVAASTLFGQQATRIGDLNGDGRPEIAISAFLDNMDRGNIWIVDGNSTGTNDVTTTALTTIASGPGIALFGGAIAQNIGTSDVNDDGIPDLVATGLENNTDYKMFYWFGGTIPLGNITSADADSSETLPGFSGLYIQGQGSPQRLEWIGDSNGDGLPDLCLGEHSANDSDGQFVVFYDDGV